MSGPPPAAVRPGLRRRFGDALPRRIGAVSAAAVYVFLYFPIAVLVLFAFVDNTTQTLPIKGFTLDWFRQAISNDTLLGAFRNSVVIALAAVVISLVIGVPAALLIDRYPFPGKALLHRFVLLPLVLPGVVTGVAFQSFYSLLGLPRSLTLVALAHGTALTSRVVTTVYARLLRMDPSLEEASRDLNMNRLQTFRRITIPSIMPAIVASSLLTFTPVGGNADQGDRPGIGCGPQYGATGVGGGGAAEVSEAGEGLEGRRCRATDPRVVAGVSTDARHGDRRADRLGLWHHDPQGPHPRAASVVSATRSVRAHAVSGWGTRSVRSLVPAGRHSLGSWPDRSASGVGDGHGVLADDHRDDATEPAVPGSVVRPLGTTSWLGCGTSGFGVGQRICNW